MLSERPALIVGDKAGPKAGRSERLKVADEISKMLQTWGMCPEVFHTRWPGDETTRGEEAIKKGYTMLVMFTGDGGVLGGAKAILNKEQEVALSGVPGKERKRVALATVQIGTVNNFAYDLRMPEVTAKTTPETVEDIAISLLGGHREEMDYGEIEDALGEKHIFMQNADAGYFAHSMNMVHHPGEEKTNDGQMPFIIQGLRELFTYRGVPVELTVDGGETESFSLVEALSANIQRAYVSLDPEIQANDGRLNGYFFKGHRAWEIVPRGLAVLALRGRSNFLAPSTPFRETVLESAIPLYFETDGEPRGKTDRLVTRVKERAIVVFIPNNKGIKILGRS